MTYKILFVDDEPANLRLLERLFRRQYEVISASSGAEALDLLALHDVAVIISDQRMPVMPGIEFLKRAAMMRQHTVRIILTGYTDVTALVEAINSGVVYKYVAKPWVNEALQQTVTRALEHYETNKQQHEQVLHNKRLTERLKAT
jgi:adenylate cyclase